MNNKSSYSTALAVLALSPLTTLAAPLNLDLQELTVSGISSGGFMANQIHIAHSDWVSGAGVIAAGPYGCSEGNLLTALANCTSKPENSIDTKALASDLQEKVAQKVVSPLKGLRNDKVWVLSGTKDTKVLPQVTDALVEQYRDLAGPDNLVYINDKPFAHHFPTENTGTSCDVSESPYVANCGYDAAGEMLKHLLGPLNAPAAELTSTPTAIAQQGVSEHDDTLADQGYVYIPASCTNGETCQVHVNFHGCNQNAEALSDQYVRSNGLNRWAETNNLVVLYPQTKNSALMPLNPQGCWDWWGYTGSDFATQQGRQMQAVVDLIHSLPTLNPGA